MGSDGKKDNVGKIDEKDRDARNRELIRRFQEGDREALNLLLEENDGLRSEERRVGKECRL